MYIIKTQADGLQDVYKSDCFATADDLWGTESGSSSSEGALKQELNAL